MTLTAAQLDRYFARDSDIDITGERTPQTSSGNQVELLIDGHSYFGAIRQEITELLSAGTNKYFYFANWWLGLVEGPQKGVTGGLSEGSQWAPKLPNTGAPAFKLDDGSGTVGHRFIVDISAMVNADVDVRAMAWLSPLLVDHESPAPHLWRINTHTLLSVQMLRATPNLQNKVILNTLAHPFGAMHLKMVVCGSDSKMVAFVSGLDFVHDRAVGRDHGPSSDKWHDAGVRLEGPAAGQIYEHFRSLWNEQTSRYPSAFRLRRGESDEFIPSHFIPPPGDQLLGEIVTAEQITPVTHPRTPPVSASGTQHVQILRTLPQMNFPFFAPDIIDSIFESGGEDKNTTMMRILARGYKQPPFSFAEHGLFEFRMALKKAIANAQHYIYMEDQSFFSIEIMEWINARLKAESNLKVVLLWGADPTDPPNEIIFEAIGNTLLDGIANPMDRIAFYKRGNDIVVHTKVAIIDDMWTVVGSANCMRRSLYTDGELSVSVMDDATPSFAQRLRGRPDTGTWYRWSECGHHTAVRYACRSGGLEFQLG